MILMEIFSYVIDALLIYVFYDKYFSKERRREFASTAVIWGALLLMEGINYVFNTMAPYIAVNMLVSVLGLFARHFCMMLKWQNVLLQLWYFR